MGNVLRQGRFADSVGADQDCVGGIVEEFERHQGIDGGLVAFLSPRPIEVAQRFEAADMRIFEAALQAATCSLLLLPFDGSAVASISTIMSRSQSITTASRTI